MCQIGVLMEESWMCQWRVESERELDVSELHVKSGREPDVS